MILKMDNKETQELIDRVDEHSKFIEDMVNQIVEPYTKSLDDYVAFIRQCLNDGTNPPTDFELEDFCLNLSTNIYFASGACEQVGIKDDISKEIYKEVYNTRRDEIRGTVADKDAYAELYSQKEQLVNIAYARAYKIIKGKVDNAQEILNSCKKVLTRRTEAMSLSKIAN